MRELHLQGRASRVMVWASAIVLALSSLFLSILTSTTVNAAEVSSRSIAMASTVEDAETDYTIQFTMPASTTAGSVIVEFCDNDPLPNTACTFTETGDDIPCLAADQSSGSDGLCGSAATESGSFTFTNATGSQCDNPALTAPTLGDQYLLITCTAPDSFSSLSSTFTGTVADIDNPDNSTDSPTNPNNSFYARIYVYSVTAPTEPTVGSGNTASSTNLVHTGGIAMSTAEQLTITARVQEILEFCVGTDTTAPTNCAAMTGNSVDIGVLDFGGVTFATTETGEQGSIMARTNAAGGINIDYFAEQAATGTNHLGSLRVSGASCNAGDVSTDQCIDSIGTTQTVISTTGPGNEAFGMCIFGVDVSSGSTNNLASGLDAEYDDDANDCDNTNGFAWDESGSADDLADTTTVVDDEMLELEFAAISEVTTPTGSYSVTMTVIGTSTF